MLVESAFMLTMGVALEFGLKLVDDMRDLSGYSVWRHAKYSSDWYKKKRGQINK